MLKKLWILFFVTFSLNAQAAPCTNISFTTTQVGDTVSFTPLLPANYVLTNISWNFGDGVGSNQTNPSHIYIATAPYNVCMTVIYSTPTGIDSCWHWESLFVVTSAGLCNASFSYQTGNGTTVNFTNTSTGTGTMSNSMWDFGDGSTSVYNVQNPSHTYASGGWYNVTLQTYYFNINTGIYNSCISNDSIYIQSGQGGPCAADFNYSVSNCTAHFSNYSSGPGILTSCLWDFGDGDTSSSWSPQHTYNATGIYNTCVSVNYLDTTSGTTSTCTYCDSVQWVQCVSVPCFAEYTYNTSGNTLYCNNTSVGNGTITSSHWNFGDGTTSMLTNPNHTYSSAGAYNVCLTVVYTTLVGSDTCTYCNSIQVGGSTPCPNNNFSHTQNGSNTINFYSSVGTNPYSCFWTFGDGTTSTFSFPSHTYSQPGTYIVCLTQVFFTPFGLDTCYHCATIQVAGSTGTCTSSFLPPPSSTGTVNFTNSSSGNGNLVASFWNFGDGATSTLTNPSHNFFLTATYNVCLTSVFATSSSSDTCTYCDSLSYTGGPGCIASFTFTQSSPNTISCVNTSVGNGYVTNVVWTWGDGTSGGNWSTPSHTYLNSGWYPVCVYNNYHYMGVHAFCDYCDTIFVAPTGSNPKNIQSNLVQVYPNPAQEMITIVLDSEQPTTVRILDVSGRVQTQLEADKAAQGISIPVRQLANGLYFIQAESQGERWHGSFLKK